MLNHGRLYIMRRVAPSVARNCHLEIRHSLPRLLLTIVPAICPCPWRCVPQSRHTSRASSSCIHMPACHAMPCPAGVSAPRVPQRTPLHARQNRLGRDVEACISHWPIHTSPRNGSTTTMAVQKMKNSISVNRTPISALQACLDMTRFHHSVRRDMSIRADSGTRRKE
jgi:hypothetical protein